MHQSFTQKPAVTIPSSFKCSLSLEIMLDPVTLSLKKAGSEVNGKAWGSLKDWKSRANSVERVELGKSVVYNSALIVKGSSSPTLCAPSLQVHNQIIGEIRGLLNEIKQRVEANAEKQASLEANLSPSSSSASSSFGL